MKKFLSFFSPTSCTVGSQRVEANLPTQQPHAGRDPAVTLSARTPPERERSSGRVIKADAEQPSQPAPRLSGEHVAENMPPPLFAFSRERWESLDDVDDWLDGPEARIAASMESKPLPSPAPALISEGK